MSCGFEYAYVIIKAFEALLNFEKNRDFLTHT